MFGLRAQNSNLKLNFSKISTWCVWDRVSCVDLKFDEEIPKKWLDITQAMSSQSRGRKFLSM